MSVWALIQDGVAVDRTTIDPAGRFHPSLEWVAAPDSVEIGQRFDPDSQTFSSPAPIPVSKAYRLAVLAAERYARESGGVFFRAAAAAGPALAASDTVSQAKLGNAYQLARDGFWVDGTPWKMQDGSFVALTAADVKALSLKVAGYVAACYAHEAQIAAALVTDLAADVTLGWPDNA